VPTLILQSPAILGAHKRQTKLTGTDTPTVHLHTVHLHWKILQAPDVLPVLTPFSEVHRTGAFPMRNRGVFTHTPGVPTATSKVSPQELPVSALH
jgi:hypothetical protein